MRNAMKVSLIFLMTSCALPINAVSMSDSAQRRNRQLHSEIVSAYDESKHILTELLQTDQLPTKKSMRDSQLKELKGNFSNYCKYLTQYRAQLNPEEQKRMYKPAFFQVKGFWEVYPGSFATLIKKLQELEEKVNTTLNTEESEVYKKYIEDIKSIIEQTQLKLEKVDPGFLRQAMKIVSPSFFDVMWQKMEWIFIITLILLILAAPLVGFLSLVWLIVKIDRSLKR